MFLTLDRMARTNASLQPAEPAEFTGSINPIVILTAVIEDVVHNRPMTVLISANLRREFETFVAQHMSGLPSFVHSSLRRILVRTVHVRTDCAHQEVHRLCLSWVDI